MDEEVLQGGITNAGSVTRIGQHVLRPGSIYSPAVHAYLRAIRFAGFGGAPMPVGIDADSRERLEFITGDVPTSPYPEWCQSDTVLASIARLVRDLHEAGRAFDARGLVWNDALADPVGGTQICHNDLELSNIAFVDEVPVAFIDFEFAAPGRPIYDVAQFARLCVPIEDGLDQARMGWKPADRPARLRIIADAYGLDQAGRRELLAAMDDALDQIEATALSNVDASSPVATAALEQTGGIEKYARRRSWWHRHRPAFAIALA